MGTCEMVRLAAAHLLPYAARSTKKTFEGAIERWLKWAWAEGKTGQPRERHLGEYLAWLALNASGENVERTTMHLLRVYREELGEDAARRIKERSRGLAKEANIRNLESSGPLMRCRGLSSSSSLKELGR